MAKQFYPGAAVDPDSGRIRLPVSVEEVLDEARAYIDAHGWPSRADAPDYLVTLVAKVRQDALLDAAQTVLGNAARLGAVGTQHAQSLVVRRG